MGHSYIIVGCGVFGLTTALELASRDSSNHITLLDRHEPPVPDGASVDSSRIIRADYGDPVYAALARRAQASWRADQELCQAYHETGMLLNTADGRAEKGYLDKSIANVRALGIEVQELQGNQVLERIVGAPVQDAEKGVGLRGYLNPVSGFADARMGIEILYRRARACTNVTFQFDTVTKLLYADETAPHRVVGVQLASDKCVYAEKTILAMGAWQMPDLCLPTMATGQVIGYIPLSKAECARFAEMPVTINFSTGWFCIPPYEGHLKVARHAEGYLNTECVVKGDGTTRYLSVPRTAVTHQVTRIPAEGEAALREGMRLYLPDLADRAFSHSRVCWYTDTPNSDFIIDWHPEMENLFIATGGSGHGYKFLPILGELIYSVMDGTADALLRKKWSFAETVEAYEQGIKGDGSRGKGARLEWSEL